MHLGVNIAILQNNQILLTKREDFEVWCMPGGVVEPGESLAQAAIRETYEETGFEVVLTRLVGLYSRPAWYDGTYHVCVFVGSITGGTLNIQPSEVLEARFFAFSDLPSDMLLGQRHRILDAINGVGGGVAKTEDFPWPFGANISRREIYKLKEESGLSPLEFYSRYTRGLDAQIITDVSDQPKRPEM